jgi:hypothetical protein
MKKDQNIKIGITIQIHPQRQADMKLKARVTKPSRNGSRGHMGAARLSDACY